MTDQALLKNYCIETQDSSSTYDFNIHDTQRSKYYRLVQYRINVAYVILRNRRLVATGWLQTICFINLRM